MSTEVRHRRGTSAEHATFTGALSEFTHDTTNNAIRVHDGATPGGNRTLMSGEKGVANGLATLGADGKVPTAQIPDQGFLTYAAQTLTPAQKQQVSVNIGSSIRGLLTGLTISNNTSDTANDFDIAAGTCASSDASSPLLLTLSSPITKRIDAAWAVGSGNGGLDTGTVTNSTYHIHLIYNPTTDVTDALFSLSASSPTLPSGFTHSRRLASFIRVSSSNAQITQVGDMFYYNTAITDRSTTSTISNTLLSLSIPTGLFIRPIIYVFITSASGTTTVLVNNGFNSTASIILARANGTGTGGSSCSEAMSNTSAQIRYTLTSDGTVSESSVVTAGYIDTRGR